MSLGQPNSTLTIGGGVPPDVTPRLKITTTLPNSGQFSFMCWAYHTGGTGDAYSDLIAITDTNDVIGMGLKNITGQSFFNMGDLNSDITDTRPIADNEWHHYCLTVGDVTGTGTRSFGYLDGMLRISGSLINPVVPTFIALINSRASDTDAGAVWIGNMCAVKIWDGPALDPLEVQREMWTYVPKRLNNLWAWSPLAAAATRTHNYAGRASVDWTTQGNWFADGTNDPPGVIWDVAPRFEPISFTSIPPIIPRPIFRPFPFAPGR
jgi:concanavalin A-like lectin/glucanase superfamily protein